MTKQTKLVLLAFAIGCGGGGLEDVKDGCETEIIAKRYVGRTHTNTAQLLPAESAHVMRKVIETFRVDPALAFRQWASDDSPQAA